MVSPILNRVNICIEKLKNGDIQTIQELVRGMPNLLVVNMHWMVAFKIQVFDASLFEEAIQK